MVKPWQISTISQWIKYSLGLEAFEYLDIKFYEVDQHDICVINCKKADNFIFCQKKGGVENVYVRTGPKTKILKPSEMEDYKKRNF